ncbi:putative lipid II flippase FtsW [Ornithinimicrobium tianjinense]|uniref:Probable peptidoglycan glycosyltransferase FtsW n=1 Tax=Ornithinimicrobium tianjinense TaxID=1195761 RepID=A0A917BHW9_9MICO|nr:putative lipid II flippase FtsW [Ornithinimicrobium tianjinense]GGF44587.1 cell division protein FtsW [Ornithinimicrobium tianjinense]
MTTVTRPGLFGRRGGSPAEGWTVASVGQWLRSPVAPYYLVLASTSLLVGLGLVMVLSASSVSSYAEDGNSYLVFLDQLMYAGVGLVLAVAASRVPVRWWKRLAWPGIIGALVLQGLVFSPLGLDSFQGNRNWLSIGGRTVQPSEFGKLALVVFGAAVLATKRRLIHKIAHATIPLIFPVGIVLLGLVLQGNDLGTGMIMVAILGGLLWTAGLPARWFVGVGAVAAAGIAFLAAGSANRMQRIQVWLGDICSGPQVAGCYQKVHAEYALADGGWWGLGLGESREKWGILPEPHNDFILAIIGEELGLPGTVGVLLLFAVLAYACFRIVHQSEDMFTRLAASGVMVWFLAQAMVNIGSVIGMLPIIGVPLPLVSSGGSALVAAMTGVGLLLALARSLPGAGEALGGRTSTLRRTLAAVPSAESGPRAGARARRSSGPARTARPAQAARSTTRAPRTHDALGRTRRGHGSRGGR